MLPPADHPHRITGILTPNITPVDDAGRVDEDRLRGYVDWLIERGVDGLYPNGSTGEFVRFSPLERRRIVQIVVDQTAGRVPVLAGAAEANVDETIAACQAYGEMGVRAVAIVAPFYYRLSSDAVHAYFTQIAGSVDVDVTLYNIPMFASPIDVETATRLALEQPRIVGIKDSSGDLPNMLRMMAAIRPQRDDFSFLTGWDPSLAPMLIAGIDGGTNASSGVVPELTRSIYRSVHTGQIDRAMDLQYDLLALFDCMIGLGEFPDGFRAGAHSRGWDLGDGRVPYSNARRKKVADAQPQIDAKIRAILQKLEKSSPRDAVSTQSIESVVHQVLQRLGTTK
ncbi:dihydrodipicolinate synthase family protein [Allorhodopirellula heiligendammensis]|uniref:4-hydroxy-tetrahydrodipicolinate synthase n=1 Tax=Allorhodopirellula heiligendammensis TaxID=2714739 RepID=A0A5C6BUH9_9BACT|nr:dihydrodipicolinate synthase family protein [Allorhodopirellula heiligendammensis]TWU15101.1 4-hydroxy-tetrahydrodipicolinate synthase [Allorhodopirellula heiligendammensis]